MTRSTLILESKGQTKSASYSWTTALKLTPTNRCKIPKFVMRFSYTACEPSAFFSVLRRIGKHSNLYFHPRFLEPLSILETLIATFKAIFHFWKSSIRSLIKTSFWRFEAILSKWANLSKMATNNAILANFKLSTWSAKVHTVKCIKW